MESTAAIFRQSAGYVLKIFAKRWRIFNHVLLFRSRFFSFWLFSVKCFFSKPNLQATVGRFLTIAIIFIYITLGYAILNYFCDFALFRRFLKDFWFYFSFFISFLFNCSGTKFIATIVNVCLFMLNFCLTVLTYRVTSTPLTFRVSRDLKFSLNHNFNQLNSIGGNLILKVKCKVGQNWRHFSL